MRYLTFTSVVLTAVVGLPSLGQVSTRQSSGEVHPPKDRARIVQSEKLPRLDGSHLQSTMVEVRYGPGESSSPHSHPCAVMAYVVEGAIRTQVKGQAETVYKAGESFYEAPNGVHLVSANASSTAPAKLVAYLLCDHKSPLSVAVQGATMKGDSK